jgi:hypothetical protein
MEEVEEESLITDEEPEAIAIETPNSQNKYDSICTLFSLLFYNFSLLWNSYSHCAFIGHLVFLKKPKTAASQKTQYHMNRKVSSLQIVD